MTPRAGHRIGGHVAAEIATSIEEGISGGTLTPGSQLPTVRGLAGELGVSTATVSAAYRCLAERGLVSGRGRGGTRVSEPRQIPLPRLPFEAPPGVLDLASGGPDTTLLPDLRPALSLLSIDLITNVGRSRGYNEQGTHPDLAEVLGAWLHAEGGPMSENSPHLTAVGGVLDGVQRVLASSTRPGDGVVVEDPTHTALLDLLQFMGLVALPVPLDGEGILPDVLHRVLSRPGRGQPKATAVVITLRAQNPTGATVTPDRAAELGLVLARHPRVLLVETDPLGPVSGAELASIATLKGSPRWAHVQGLSAMIGPDLRLAGLSADRVTATRVRRIQHVGTGWVSWILQAIAHHALSSTDHTTVMVNAAATYMMRRETLVKALSSRGVQSLPGHGFHVWVPVAAEACVAQAVLAGGIAVRAGESFRLQSPPGIRISTSHLDPSQAEHVAAVVASACSGWPRTEDS